MRKIAPCLVLAFLAVLILAPTALASPSPAPVFGERASPAPISTEQRVQNFRVTMALVAITLVTVSVLYILRDGIPGLTRASAVDGSPIGPGLDEQGRFAHRVDKKPLWSSQTVSVRKAPAAKHPAFGTWA